MGLRREWVHFAHNGVFTITHRFRRGDYLSTHWKYVTCLQCLAGNLGERGREVRERSPMQRYFDTVRSMTGDPKLLAAVEKAERATAPRITQPPADSSQPTTNSGRLHEPL